MVKSRFEKIGKLSPVALGLASFAVASATLVFVLRSQQPPSITVQPSQIGECVEKASGAKNQHPPVTSNEDFQGEKGYFTFSPDKKFIAFVQNVFDEYGNDWDNYWALNVFDPKTKEEKTLIIDDTRMSSYEWFTDKTIRVYHNAGTGIRVYLDMSVDRETPLFTRDYEGPDIWTPDAEYSRKSRDNMEARRVYFGEEK